STKPSSPISRYTLGWPSAPPPPSQATRLFSVSTVSGASTGMEKFPVWREENRRLGGSYKLRFARQELDWRMVRLSKIYTKTGDSGETGLGDGSRISKASRRVRAIGAVDETNAAIGIARLDAEGDADAMLGRIQTALFDLRAALCV